MTPQQILIVAVRLFAIFWFVISIGHLVSAARTWENTGPDILAVIGVFVPILELVVSAVLWLFPATLSRRLLKSDDWSSDAPGPALLEWQAMLTAVLGLWVLSWTIPDVVYWISYFIALAKIETGYKLADVLADQLPYVASTVVQLGIGGWLILGAPGFSEFLLRVRDVGLRK